MMRLVRVPTAVSDAVLADCLADLPLAEQQVPRAGLPAWRRRVAAHAALRRLVGEHLGLTPRQLRLQRQRWGKPVLAATMAQPAAEDAGNARQAVHFNLSYTGDEALLALASSPVGVDIERTIPDDVAQVARHVYADEERERLHGGDSAQVFLDIWTAKEAVLKLLGVGFRVEPRMLCVPPAAQGFQPVCVAAALPQAPPCVVANWRLAQGGAIAVAVHAASAPSAITWERYAHGKRH